MAWASGGDLGTSASKTSGTTLDRTTIGACLAGDVVVVAVVSDNTGTSDTDSGAEVSSVTDSAGNTYVKARERVNGSPGAAAGTVAAIFYSKLTADLPFGSTVTVTWASARDARAMSMWKFTIGAGNVVTVDGQSSGTPEEATTAPSATIGSLSNIERLWVSCLGIEGPADDGFTQDADYTNFTATGTLGDPQASNIALRAGYRILTGTTDTHAPTLGTARDLAHVYVAFKEAAGSPDVTRDLSGEQGTSALGALLVAIALAISGVSATAAPGSVGQNRTISISGVSATTSVNTVTYSSDNPDITIPLVANEYVMIGGVVLDVYGAFADVGSLATNRTLELIPTPFFLGATGEVGSVGYTEQDVTVDISGFAVVGSTVVGDVGASRSLALAGEVGTGAAGTAVRAMDLTGVVGAGSVGTIIASEAGAGNIDQALFGIQSTGQVGNVLASIFIPTPNVKPTTILAPTVERIPATFETATYSVSTESKETINIVSSDSDLVLIGG